MGSSRPTVRVKRIYDDAEPSDGLRVLVDRVWPRGMKKDAAKIDHWEKELAPSTGLRKWFGHDPERWPEFKQRYFEELRDHRDRLRELLDEARSPGTLTLLFAAKDTEHNNAVALKAYLGMIK